jgi:hypothetical protein
MATPFTALGSGNGFSQCLNTISLPPENVVLNPPTLAETMSAYWNVDSISFGGASFDPTNEPKDLICTPSANQGSDTNIIQNTSTRYEAYSVSISHPYKIDDNGTINYVHGLVFQYDNNTFNIFSGGFQAYTNVTYRSTFYRNNSIPYVCNPVYYGSPPYIVGYNAEERIVTATSVTISGIPFVKVVTQYFSEGDYSANPSCPPFSANPVTSSTPSITLHTY